MNDYPLQRIMDFVRRVVPFDSLGEETLSGLVDQMEIAYYPGGSEIFAQGSQPPDFLHIIQSGSAKLTLSQDQGEMLVDVRAEGDVLGDTSILQGSSALFTCRAREDLICYLLPAAIFRRLVAEEPVFQRHFQHSLARNLQAVQSGGPGAQAVCSATEAASLDAALMGSRVRDLMRTPVLTCLPSTPIRAAARMMTRDRVGAIVVLQYDNLPVGIVTDSDLRARVVAQGADTSSQAADFMSRPLHLIGPDAFVFEALVAMSRHGVHHLVVAEKGHMLGIVSDHDLQSLTGGSPVTVAREIENCLSLDELVELRAKIDRVLEMMLSQGGSAPELLALVTEYNDRLTRRLIDLVLAELIDEGYGAAPVPFVWLAFGSEGRKEQTLSTDQDNGLIYQNQPVSRERGVKRWFLAFSERVVDGLELCGFPLCKGNVMASNPSWCQSQRAWRKTFRKWVGDPRT
jgi:CBS domain-containing protein